MTEQRKKFEEWWLSGSYGNRPTDRFEDKGVSEDEVFEVWQATIAAAERAAKSMAHLKIARAEAELRKMEG